MNSVVTALGAIFAPVLEAVEQKLASIGAAVTAGFTVILAGFANDERAIIAAALALWQSKFHEARAAGKDVIESAEEATTAALNKFCSDEFAGVPEGTTGGNYLA